MDIRMRKGADMNRVQARRVIASIFAAIFFIVSADNYGSGSAQSPSSSSTRGSSDSGRPVIIPVTVRVKGRTAPRELELQTVILSVSEDSEPQTILSIRAIGTNAPINLIVLIQDDVVSSVGLEIKALSEFIRRLPRDSRVFVGYLRSGSLQIRHKFTADLEKAAKSLRSPLGVASAAPYNPYVEVIEALRRFDSQRAIDEAQRRSVAIYSFFAPTVTSSMDSNLLLQGQSSLNRLSDETGGHAVFQGLGIPTSFDPFLKELRLDLDKQIALSYLSTHPRKGFHRLKLIASTPDVELNYPAGY